MRMQQGQRLQPGRTIVCSINTAIRSWPTGEASFIFLVMMPVPDSEFILEQETGERAQAAKQQGIGSNPITVHENYADKNIARARAFLINPSTNEWMDVATGTCIVLRDENAKKDCLSIAIQNEPPEPGMEQSSFNGAGRLNEANAGTIGFRTAFGRDQDVTLQQGTTSNTVTL